MDIQIVHGKKLIETSMEGSEHISAPSVAKRLIVADFAASCFVEAKIEAQEEI